MITALNQMLLLTNLRKCRCTGRMCWVMRRRRRLQMLSMLLTHLSVVMTTVSVSLLDDVDAVSCLTARRHCLSDAACRRRLDTIHDVCGDNSQYTATNRSCRIDVQAVPPW